ncbi:hypothetical protein V6N13_110462 [Hibiscus sabdariffa]
MITSGGDWDWARLVHLLPATIILCLAAIKCPLPHFPRDAVGWNGTASGKFTIKSTYHIRHDIEEGPNEDIWRIVMNYKERARSWLVTIVVVVPFPMMPRQSLEATHRRRLPWSLPPSGWVKVQHIGCERNVVADGIAKYVKCDDLDIVYWRVPPLSIMSLLHVDELAELML